MHASEELARRLESATQALVPLALEAVRAEAAALCPVDSGALRQSLHIRMEEGAAGAQGQVVADVPYATLVELGSFARPGQPYLSPAFHLVRPGVPAMLAKLLGG